MILIKRDYHFYAAHRNEFLDNKCRNIHGHTYYVQIELQFEDAKEQTGVTMLFESIDTEANKVLRAYDHAFMINVADPLYEYLQKYGEDTKDPFKFVLFKQATSVENLAERIFRELFFTLPVISVSVRETMSAVVTYKPSLNFGRV